MQDRMAGLSDRATTRRNSQDDDPYLQPTGSRRSKSTPARRGSSREDDEMRRALEESRRMAEESGSSSRPQPTRSNTDADLEKAMRLSREDEERRKADLARNGGSLFDEQQQQCVSLLHQTTRAN